MAPLMTVLAGLAALAVLALTPGAVTANITAAKINIPTRIYFLPVVAAQASTFQTGTGMRQPGNLNLADRLPAKRRSRRNAAWRKIAIRPMRTGSH